MRRFLAPLAVGSDAPALKMRIDVSEKDESYLVKAEIPGHGCIEKSDRAVSLQPLWSTSVLRTAAFFALGAARRLMACALMRPHRLRRQPATPLALPCAMPLAPLAPR